VNLTRRALLKSAVALAGAVAAGALTGAPWTGCSRQGERRQKENRMAILQTVLGPVDSSTLGLILPHEHLFTDLRTPDAPGQGEGDPADVVRVMKPYLD
jgi:hypothetical protein